MGNKSQSIHERYLKPSVKDDLKKKMVFVGGPRQVGKTTFAQRFLKHPSPKHPAYLNWDLPQNRPTLLRGELPTNQKLIIFDEIHKFARWRNLIKGLYDHHHDQISFLITGSARLDYYRKGGDSLQGRYHYYRLHPFSLMELNRSPTSEDLKNLLHYGGFPEPLFAHSEQEWRRWSLERHQRVIYEDLADLERVKEVSMLELLLDALPDRVGAPLSIQNLRELLQVAHHTVERWITILENLYVCFRIAPYGSERIRAVKKEQKLYFWDWRMVPELGPRFENLVACQLLKYCHFIEDTQGYRMELRYLRDIDKREVDFVVLQDKKPLFAVECKSGEKSLNPAVHYFQQRSPIPTFYQVHMGAKDQLNKESNIRILPFITFCKELALP